jgi:hypothetical protein
MPVLVLVKRALTGLLLAAGSMSPGFFLLANPSLAASQSAGKKVATIRRVAVLNSGNNFELEISASQPVAPQTQVVTGPDRLVIDFPQSVPGAGLRPVVLHAGEVKGIRVGLFASNPPVTRVVLDLNSPQPYQVFPSGNGVIVKINSSGSQAAAPSPAITMAANIPPQPASPQPPAPVQPPPPPAPTMQVAFANGKLSIRAERAMLSDVLNEVQRLTGATVNLPPGGAQEPVIANIGPSPAREALTALLEGSSYNFILVGSERDPSVLRSIMLTPRGAAVENMPANYTPPPMVEAAPEPPVEAQPPPPETDAPPPESAPPPQ